MDKQPPGADLLGHGTCRLRKSTGYYVWREYLARTDLLRQRDMWTRAGSDVTLGQQVSLLVYSGERFKKRPQALGLFNSDTLALYHFKIVGKL